MGTYTSDALRLAIAASSSNYSNIGTNKTGASSLPNRVGVSLWGPNDRLGTNGDGVNDEAERNVISGNLEIGVVGGGLVAGNYIGTDATGLLPLGNGVGIVGGGTVGGTAPGMANVISGNLGAGIDSYGGSNGAVIQGNYIGVDKTGAGPLGNGGDGIWLRFESSNNTIGSAAGAADVPAAANTIAYNGRNGITVSAGLQQFGNIHPATNDSIRGNLIFANAGLGIDLAELQRIGGGPPSDDPYQDSYVFGVTPNDPLDADTGNNQLQNFPVLASAYAGATARIKGSLNSTPNTTFTLDFYANATADPSGYGEGQRYLGSAVVTSDGNGDVSFNVLVAGAATTGEFITATATDLAGNTSEFSAGVAAISADVTVSVTGGTFTYDGHAHGATSSSVTGADGFTATPTLAYYVGTNTSGPGSGTAPTNAGTYTVVASYAGDSNHNPGSGSALITIQAKDLSATSSTETSINIAKAGTINFALSNVTGIVAGDGTVYDLFNGAMFHLKVGANLYSVSSTASVLGNGTVQISWRMTQELYNDLYLMLGSATPSNKTLVDLFVSGTSKNGNYTITEDVFSQIFQQGKVVFN